MEHLEKIITLGIERGILVFDPVFTTDNIISVELIDNILSTWLADNGCSSPFFYFAKDAKGQYNFKTFDGMFIDYQIARARLDITNEKLRSIYTQLDGTFPYISQNDIRIYDKVAKNNILFCVSKPYDILDPYSCSNKDILLGAY